MFVPAQNLPGHSRIWIYQCNRELTADEVNSIGEKTRNFLESWTAHNNELKAGYEIRYHRFLILMIDEQVAGASGCSIDKSVHFIQSLEKEMGVTFMDRMQFAYKAGDHIDAVTRTAFENLFTRGLLTDETHVFNNLVSTKAELDSSWEVPLKDSWHRNLVGTG
jgi:hypothetical protein